MFSTVGGEGEDGDGPREMGKWFGQDEENLGILIIHLMSPKS